MNQLLQRNDKLSLVGSSAGCIIDKFIGGGTQGEVYRAQLGDTKVAIKWYFPSYLKADKGLRRRLERAVKDGPPTDRFLWPQALVDSDSKPGFGYIMELRPDNYVGISDLVHGKADPSFKALARAGYGLVDSYFQLHSRGLCYRDISFGNVFFDPETGDVLICDNDNVDIDGEAGPISGTPKFMAPELVRGEALPTRATDLHSLAVLLFYIFFIHHPLEGARMLSIKCLDLPAHRELYGTKPVFIFDPSDGSNSAQPFNKAAPADAEAGANALVYWQIYPEFLKNRFMQAFTRGLRDAEHGRVVESIWRKDMLRLMDSIFRCQCGRENFYDATLHEKEEYQGTCWSCGHKLIPPRRLKFDGHTVVLDRGSVLRKHHLESATENVFGDSIAIVVPHPTKAHVLGLTNDSSEKWVVTQVDGKTLEVPPSMSIGLVRGLRINFGKASGEVE